MRREIEKLKEWLLSKPYGAYQSVYAILDAARDTNVLVKLQQLGIESVSLYRGEPEETLAPVAPYLTSLENNMQLTNWVLGEGWGKGWSIFLIAPTGIEELRRHFRHFLLVRDPDGKELYFRFYDPRVLRVYLPTCTASEVKQFFGQLTAYLMESENGEAVLEFTRIGLRTMPLSELSLGTEPESRIIADFAAGPSPKPRTRRLKIREEQMKAFSEYMNNSFQKRAALHLRKEYPNETEAMADAELHALILEGTNRASKYQLIRETEIGVFLDLMVLFGVDFNETAKWADEILEDPDPPSEDKVERLRQLRDSELERRTVKHDE